MNRVDAYFLNPSTGNILQQKTTGLSVPLEGRTVGNGKTIIPVQLNAGESQLLLLKVSSDSLPFISVKNWAPEAYTQLISDNRILQVALLSGILTLLVVLVLQFDIRLLIAGLWLLVALVFETEKDGFFSNYLFSFLADYSPNLRVSAWILTEYMFLMTSAFLLGLSGHRGWRAFLALCAIPMLAIPWLSFILDGGSIRNLGIGVASVYAVSWLFMVLPAIRVQRFGQTTIIVLLTTYWGVSSFLLLGYTFNFYYTSAFTAARIYVEILVALALILTYSWQQKHQLKAAAQALSTQRLHHRQALEQAVKDRTEDLNTALETARKASKAKVNFLGQVTHDLRSPLTAILGYVQLQSAGAVDGHKANQVIQDRALYMKELIDGLVNYARDITVDEEEIEDIYLIAFIDNLVNHAHIIASKQNNRFQLIIETDLPTVIRCRSKQLQRILLNLLDNAAKYTSEGNFSLSIAAEYSSGPEQSLSFCVSDTGRGISADDLKKIYTPFYQSSESNPGAGLGLPICFELAENLGGTLELESELGVGTTATCTIPCIVGDEQLAAPSLATIHDLLPAFDANGQKAWIVEDSPSINELLNNEFTELGFEVKLFTTAEAFSETVARNNDGPDVVITDYRLPGASGAKVLHAVRSKWRSVPVILLSGSLNSTSRPEDGHAERFDAYLSKPVDLQELRMTVSELCKVPLLE